MGRFKYNLDKETASIEQKAEEQEGLSNIQQCKE